MTTNYRDPAQFVPSEEEATSSSSSSSSSGEESQVLTSSSSRYFVQSVLGEGGFGKVVKCVKTATRKTVDDLADSYPNSFYVKSCCEMMEVCQDQSLSVDNRDQASRRDLPAWHSRQEHPGILELASALSSCLAISTDQDPSEPQGKDEERTQPELQLPIIFDQAFTEQQKRKRRMRRLFHHSRIAPSEGPTDAPEMKPPRKRTWDSAHGHSGSRSPGFTSPKRMKMNQDGVQTLKGD